MGSRCAWNCRKYTSAEYLKFTSYSSQVCCLVPCTTSSYVVVLQYTLLDPLEGRLISDATDVVHKETFHRFVSFVNTSMHQTSDFSSP